MKKSKTFIAVAGAFAGLLALSPVVDAAKGGNGGGGGGGTTISIDGWNPHVPYGEQVTFSVSTTRTDRPWVNARCYQDGGSVYGQWHGLFDGYGFEPVFTMGPTPSWSGGDAECVAEVGFFHRGSFRALASTSFLVVDERG